MCGVPRCDQDSTPHTNKFHSQTTRVLTVNTGNLAKISPVWTAFYRNFTGKEEKGLDEVVLCFRLPSARFLIFFCSTWQSTWCVSLSSGFRPHNRISGRKYSTCWIWFEISAAPMFFQADSIISNTHHSTGKFDKIICRAINIVKH